MLKILPAHGFPKETVTTIIMLYKNMKNTDYVDIVTGVLQGDTLGPNISPCKYWLTSKNLHASALYTQTHTHIYIYMCIIFT